MIIEAAEWLHRRDDAESTAWAGCHGSAFGARAARDAAHWRASCYASLKTDGALAAKPCFQAHERHQRLWHTPSSYDSVPLGLVAMAHGDVSAAVAALSAAYKTDPAATQKLLERAAAAIAPT